MIKTRSVKLFDDKILMDKYGCWLWQGYCNEKGYGKFHHRADCSMAHRFSYVLFKGAIPEGLQIDHLCRTRNCVNPNHLEAVTCQENIRRGTSGKYQLLKTHCPAGHPYEGENLVRYKNTRVCRTCKNANLRKSRALKRKGV